MRSAALMQEFLHKAGLNEKNAVTVLSGLKEVCASPCALKRVQVWFQGHMTAAHLHSTVVLVSFPPVV